jgi:hypothetical protein
VAKICPSILFVSGIEMQVNIFKITMKSNVVATMEAPFHVNPLTCMALENIGSFLNPKAFISRFFQVGRDDNSASVGVNGR